MMVKTKAFPIFPTRRMISNCMEDMLCRKRWHGNNIWVTGCNWWWIIHQRCYDFGWVLYMKIRKKRENYFCNGFLKNVCVSNYYFCHLNIKMQIHWIISQAVNDLYLCQIIKSVLREGLTIRRIKPFFYYIVFIMSVLYTDSHKRYSKKMFSQTANPVRRNLKHGIAQHIWNYAYVVDIQLHCYVNTYIPISYISKPQIIWIIKWI